MPDFELFFPQPPTSWAQPAWRGIVRSRIALVALVVVLVAAAACTSGKSGQSGAPAAEPSATTAHQHATTAPGTGASPTQLRAEFEQALGQNSLLVARQMRAVVAGSPELQQAIGASLSENTAELTRLVTAAYDAGQGDRFKELWQRRSDALGAYAEAVAKGDEAAKKEALTALNAYAADHGTWFAKASKGRAQAEASASGVRSHLQELTGQLDAYAARDYAKSYQIERMAFEHSFTAGSTKAAETITPELSLGFDAPPERLRSAFTMLLGEHMQLIIGAQRAALTGAPEFKAAAAQLNANTATITKALGAIVGPQKAAEFQAAWASHVEGLMAYTAGVASNDEAKKATAEANLQALSSRLALFFSDIVKNELPVEPLTKAVTEHDNHLIGQVNAYAAKDYTKAQQMELDGYKQMLGVANTLVGAIQRTVKSGMPVGGSKTGGGGTAHSRHDVG
jgi:hypothetical protein